MKFCRIIFQIIWQEDAKLTLSIRNYVNITLKLQCYFIPPKCEFYYIGGLDR